MERRVARMGPNEIYGLQPKYLRHNLWDKELALSPTTAEWSKHASPLPWPSLSKVSNPAYLKTITDNPHLFQVLTPVKVDVFESFLKDHPDQPFVRSVCAGLREGYWPWANTLNGEFPVTHDESQPMPSNLDHLNFIRDQCLKERHKGYFSESFGSLGLIYYLGCTPCRSMQFSNPTRRICAWLTTTASVDSHLIA